MRKGTLEILQKRLARNQLIDAAQAVLDWFNSRSKGFRKRCSLRVFENLTKALEKEKGLSALALLIVISALCVVLVSLTVIDAQLRRADKKVPSPIDMAQRSSFETWSGGDPVGWVWDERVRTNCFGGFEYYIKGADNNILAPVFDLATSLPKKCTVEKAPYSLPTDTVGHWKCGLYGYDEERGTYNRVRVGQYNTIIDELKKFKKLAVHTIPYDKDSADSALMIEFERSQ